MINRRIAAAILAKKFVNDYDEVIKHYETDQQIELTVHLLKVIELMQEHQQSSDDNLFKKWQKEESKDCVTTMMRNTPWGINARNPNYFKLMLLVTIH